MVHSEEVQCRQAPLCSLPAPASGVKSTPLYCTVLYSPQQPGADIAELLRAAAVPHAGVPAKRASRAGRECRAGRQHEGMYVRPAWPLGPCTVHHLPPSVAAVYSPRKLQATLSRHCSHVELDFGAAQPLQNVLGCGGNHWRDQLVNAAVPNKEGQLQVGGRHLQGGNSGRRAGGQAGAGRGGHGGLSAPRLLSSKHRAACAANTPPMKSTPQQDPPCQQH